jgi:hypothetical protein
MISMLSAVADQSTFKYFWLKIAMAALLVGLILYALMTYVLHDEEIGWGLRYYRYKNSYATSLPNPKIVIVGNSSALFGVRAEEISAVTGRPAVNLGISGGFSGYFLLQQLKAVARKGDLVLFMPDLEIYGGGLEDIEWMTQFDYNVLRIEHPEQVTNVPFSKRLRYLLGVNLVDAISYTLIVELKQFIRGDNLKPSELSDQGDYNVCTGVFPGSIVTTGIPILHQKSAIIKWMKQALDDLKDLDLKFVVSFVPRAYTKDYDGTAWNATADQMIAFLKSNGFQVIGHPKDFIYPRDHFCNAYTHLNLQSAILNTQKIIELIKANNL